MGTISTLEGENGIGGDAPTWRCPHEMDRHRIEGGEGHPPPRLDAAYRERMRVDVNGSEELIERAVHGTALPQTRLCGHFTHLR